MKKALSCSAQDMLEAAIVQKRRLNLRCLDESGNTITHPKILPVDIFTDDGNELLIFMTTDKNGGIIRLKINTQLIMAFEADDFLDPRIIYNSDKNNICSTD